MTEPTPVMAANTAVAALRAGPLGKVVAISARPVGDAIAAPTPCSSRAMTNVVSSHAMPHRIEAMVNSATPTMKVHCGDGVAEPSAEQHQAPEGQDISGDDQLRPASDRLSHPGS